MNKLIWVLMLLMLCFFTGCSQEDVILTSEESLHGTSETSEQENSSLEDTDEVSDVFVYVCGHVKNPGVYSLPEQARIVDALELAGGLTEDGNGLALNQAECVTDGMTLYVPGCDEAAEPKTETDDGLININTADKETLMTVPGIGESKADAIISYREQNGNFSKVEDLMNISGIKEGVFNKIKSHVKVTG